MPLAEVAPARQGLGEPACDVSWPDGPQPPSTPPSGVGVTVGPDVGVNVGAAGAASPRPQRPHALFASA
jgi:hypothetical protein